MKVSTRYHQARALEDMKTVRRLLADVTGRIHLLNITMQGLSNHLLFIDYEMDNGMGIYESFCEIRHSHIIDTLNEMQNLLDEHEQELLHLNKGLPSSPVIIRRGDGRPRLELVPAASPAIGNGSDYPPDND
jgi:hypothetical protein